MWALLQDSIALFQVDFSDPRWKDVNVVSSLLKAFLRKISEPLLTDKYYPIFIDANRIPDHSNRLRKLRTLVRTKNNSEFENAVELRYFYWEFFVPLDNRIIVKLGGFIRS